MYKIIKKYTLSRISTILIIVLMVFSQTVVFADSSQNFSIQMGRFNNEANAIKLQEKITSDGNKAIVFKTTSYTVYFGLYSNREDAIKALSLAQKYVKDAYLIKANEAVAKAFESNFKVETEASDTENAETNTSETDVTAETAIEESKINANINIETDGSAYNQLVGNDILLQGVYGQASMFFTVNKYWNLNDNIYFDLYFQHAYTGQEHGSSITVELNGVPVESFFIDKLDSSEHIKRIFLSKSAVNQGFNEIKIRSYHRITDLICEDDTNPANWTTIFGKSFLHLEYDDVQSELSLRTFPFPYLKDYEDKPVQFTFLVDGKPNFDIIKTMMTIASDTGKRVKFKNVQFEVVDLKNMKSDENYIFIGTDIPKELNSIVEVKSGSEMYITQGQVGDKNSILAIIASQTEYLPKIAQGLANDVWKDQLSNNFISFDDQDLSYQISDEEKNIFNFSELGYSSVTLEGAKTSTAQFFVDIPDNWTLEKEASIILKMRYSKVIDYDNSSASVIINGIPIGSEILHEDGADEDIITFIIPEELKEAKAFAISVNIYLDGNFDCQDGSINTNYWAYISNESTLYLPHVPKLKYDLSHYPAPFVSNFQMDQLNFVLDTKFDMEEINLLLGVVGYLSHEISQVPDFSITLDDGIKDKNNIFIVRSESNLFKNLNNRLNIPYLFDSNQFESIESRRLLDPFNQNLSSIQLLSQENSPYLDLVISYQGNNGSKWITPFLTNFEFVSKLGGNSIFVDQNGYYQVFNTDITEDINKPTLINQNVSSQPKRVSYENSRNFLIFLGFMLVVIIIIIITVAMKSKRTLK